MLDDVNNRERIQAHVKALYDHLDDDTLSDAVGRAAAHVANREGTPVEKLRAELDAHREEFSSGGDRTGAPFIANHPIVSVLQTTLERKERAEPGLLAGLAQRLHLHLGRLEPQDPRWIAVVREVLERIAQGNHPFNPNPAIHKIDDDNFRIVIVGDWGSGTPGARRVAAQMKREVQKVVRPGSNPGTEPEVHVVHLGDVYYSGDDEEYNRNVLADGAWPVTWEDAQDRNVTSWSLNGNHDMYSGGFGYFKTLLVDERFKAQRSDGNPTSFFHIQSPSWNIIGLDTAYDDNRLALGHAAVLNYGQEQFVEDVVVKASAPTEERKRKLLLLSHHPLISVYETGRLGTILDTKLATVFDQDQSITAWFWGHEHRCMTYSPDPRVKYPRCVGHGGIPVPARPDDFPPPPDPDWEERDSYTKNNERWTRFGFAVLDFDRDQIHVRYQNDVSEDAVRREEIPETLQN